MESSDLRLRRRGKRNGKGGKEIVDGEMVMLAGRGGRRVVDTEIVNEMLRRRERAKREVSGSAISHLRQLTD